MSIGNLPKRIRGKYSSNAFPVVAYFPVLEGTAKERLTNNFRDVKTQLYHSCMSSVLHDLIEAGKRFSI